MLSFRTYCRWEDLESFKGDWNKLVDESPTREIFLRYEWLRAWSRSKTRDTTLNVILVFDEGRLAGIAPLMYSTIRILGVTLRTLEFVGTPNSDYCDLIYADEHYLQPLWEQTRKAAELADVLRLREIKESSPTCEFLKRRPGLITRPATVGLSARLPESPDASPREYLKGAGMRERTLRRIEKEGTVGLTACATPAEMKSNLQVLFEQHISRWNGTPTPSFFRQEVTRDLYANWVEDLGPQVALWVLTLNEAPVATIFGFLYNRKLVVHSITYNNQFRQLHCGLVCIHKVMQTLRARGIDWIDFTRGTEDFKFYFADVPTMSYHFHALRTLKARCVMGIRIKAKDVAARSETLRRLAHIHGYRLDLLDKQQIMQRFSEENQAFGEGELNMVCQVTDGLSFSSWAISHLFHRFTWYLREDGVARTLRKTGAYVWNKVYPVRAHGPKRPAPICQAEVLNLQPGEWVEVRTKEEIQQWLDASGKHRGMQFMPQMKRSCGKRFRVYKRLDAIFLEENQERRRVRNTVLLEDSICDGRGVGCDRSCFFFWREAWLKRADGPGEQTEEMVEAAGVEPASEMARRDKTTCVSGSESRPRA